MGLRARSQGWDLRFCVCCWCSNPPFLSLTWTMQCFNQAHHVLPEVPPGLAVLTMQLQAQCSTTGEISASWDKALEPLLALPAVWCQVVARGLWSNVSSILAWLCDLAAHSHPSLTFLICKLGILTVIQYVFTEGLLWQKMCWKLGVQRGVRLSQCPCVLLWLCIPGMQVGIL